MPKRDSYLDAIGKPVEVGDTVIYYSGNQARLKTAKVKRIFKKEKWGWVITLDNGSKVSNPTVTQKAQGASQ